MTSITVALFVRKESLGPATLREERGVSMKPARIGSGDHLGYDHVLVVPACRRYLVLQGGRVARQPGGLVSVL